MKNNLPFLCCLAAWLAAFVPSSAASAAECIRMGDDRLCIGVDPSDGSLRELSAPPGGFNQIAGVPPSFGLWQLRIRNGETTAELGAEQAGPPVVETLPGARPEWRLTWNGTAAGTVPLRVEVRVRPDGTEGALSRWQLSVAKPGHVLIEQVRFPRVSGLAPRPQERLAVPRQLGMLAESPRALTRGKDGRGTRLNWRSPHGSDLSLPCLAFYGQDGPGFYAACDDRYGWIKTFSLWGDEQERLHFEILHEPEQAAAGLAEFQLPFTAVLGAFQGDWSTAAEIYRASETARWFTEQGRRRREASPAWVSGTGLWLWNRGRSQEVLDPAVVLRKHVKTPVGVLWHWWHECPYDAGFPEYLPPREGAEPFRNALAAARRQDVRAIVYMNQRLWGATTRSWAAEGAEDYAVRGKDGKVALESYNVFMKAPCAPMCIGTRFWRDKYAGIAREVLLGLMPDGIYMDQVGVLAACHDPRHGHITGPGRYWADGFAALAGDIRDRTSVRGPVALGGEYAGEPWIGQFDLHLGLCVAADRMGASPAWETIPFFQAVYHPAAVVFGNMAGLARPPYDEKWPQETAPPDRLATLDRKFSRQFYLEHARTFVWGMQPMLANFLPGQLRERPEEMDYVARLARVRMNALKYLLHGTWLRPPPLDVPRRETDVVKMGVYTRPQESRRIHPLALAGAWRAPDGDVGIALASVADEPLSLSLPLDAADWKLRDGCAVWRTDEKGRRRAGRFDADHPVWKLDLPPRALCVLEFGGTP